MNYPVKEYLHLQWINKISKISISSTYIDIDNPVGPDRAQEPWNQGGLQRQP